MPRSPQIRPRLQRLLPVSPAWWQPLGLVAHSAAAGPHQVHWVEAGSGEPALVLLHGLSGSSRWWQRNLPALSVARRVLVPDVIGFGRGPAGGRLPAPAELGELLAGWLREVAAGPVHLVGHSMGGLLAVHIAAAHPSLVSRLV